MHQHFDQIKAKLGRMPSAAAFSQVIVTLMFGIGAVVTATATILKSTK